jgi:predicted molibdopterin-dependent oxidoreductase YjgC
VEAPVRRSDRIARGTCFLSFHHPASHTNRLIGPQRDPESDCPEYKVTAVRVEPAATR